MANLWKQCVLGGLALVAALGSQGCTDDETGLYIRANLARIAPQCTVTADPGATQLANGLLDIAERSNYEATLLVGNQLTPRGDKQNLRTESMVITITGAVVHLTDAVGATVADFSVPANGVVVPDGGDEPGFGLVDVTLIPGSEVENLFMNELSTRDPDRAVTRVARVSVFGSTVGGLDIESSEFTYVISVCNGCQDCTLNGTRPTFTDGACRRGQDGAVCAEEDTN
jgi:hypothetical protein